MKCLKFFFVLTCIMLMGIFHFSFAQISNDNRPNLSRRDPLIRTYITPSRIIWEQGKITNSNLLLNVGNGQSQITNRPLCTISNNDTTRSSVLLDFGRELHGGLQLVTGMFKGHKPVKIHLCFGESVSEALSHVSDSENSTATNDHAMRDYDLMVPWLGKIEIGNSGFRFVRIDLAGANKELILKEVNAILVDRSIPYLGSFHSSDSLLDKIWMTGAYTVHLNMQDYLWDGIKRDRLVWVGDMHPEVSTLISAFGYNEVVPHSLDLVRNETTLPAYMNGIVSYSMWWIIIQRDWYLYTGNLLYLKQQKAYLDRLLHQLMLQIDTNGREELRNASRFLDWPSSDDTIAIHAGLQSQLILALEAGAYMEKQLGNLSMKDSCSKSVTQLKKHIPEIEYSKQAAALMSLSGLMDSQKANDIISRNGVHDYSTFFGYYMLQAKAMAGDYTGALHAIRSYWGGMLSLGATTFWEDFNIDWLQNAGRIDEIVPSGKIDVHGQYGNYCYKGYRHSLSHGWASGPTAWLTRYVLGVEILEPGCKKILLHPHLGDLSYVNGSYPTPYGIITIKHVKLTNGKIKTTFKAPHQVKVILD